MLPDARTPCRGPKANLSRLLPSAAPRRATAAAPASLSALPARIRLEPENVRNGLAQLVLTLVELLRELLERQAIRRMDAGSLTDEEIERMGQTFCRLAEEIERLKGHIGLRDEDLNLDLGPLGKLR
jgi:hypothetical protein